MSLEKYTHNYLANSIIFNEGDEGSEMFVVKKGKVLIEITIKTKEGPIQKPLGEILPGDYFGEMSIIDNSPRSARAVALTDTTLVSLNKNRFYNLIENSPEFAIKMVRKLSSRLKDANDRTKNAIKQKKKSGIVGLLLQYIEKDEVETPDLKVDIQNFYDSLEDKESLNKDEIVEILQKLESLDLLQLKKEKNLEILNLDAIKKISAFLNLFDEV